MDMFDFFLKTFGIKVVCDPTMTMTCNRPICDMFDFAYKLFKKLGISVEEEISFEEVIRERYGKEAVAKTMYYLGVD